MINQSRRIKQYLTFTLMGGVALALWALAPIVMMPGRTYNGSFLPLKPAEFEVCKNLRRNLTYLAGDIGERNFQKEGSLTRTADYIATTLSDFQLKGATLERQKFTYEGREFENIVFELKADRPAGANQIVLIGAHYDTVVGCPGADDNGSGVVSLIELARMLGQFRHHKTLRFVAFPNEEYYFRSKGMGSYQYAKRCHDRGEKIVAMLALETIGYYSDHVGSQQYPPPIGLLYPDRGNFVAFVGNYQSRDLVHRVIASFRFNCKFPSQGIAAPEMVPGIDWSDHLPFWQFDYPALMVTDTALYRNPCYHKVCDVVDKIDFDRMARVVVGVASPITALAND